eukprot:CAMPEP_0172720420 /NCGR_PEP_ID=MMETSP1074-20121228/76855_1 /TAXON_ID=2916 /ORGANISM="Ceratium fusus, Strain PA161109" /LENGTH=83 /DNA_ID=CAMNT_0013545937 /DNA_START=477 /DNA_END=728 /DNA_ORIENTATION=-
MLMLRPGRIKMAPSTKQMKPASSTDHASTKLHTAGSEESEVMAMAAIGEIWTTWRKSEQARRRILLHNADCCTNPECSGGGRE